MRPPGIETTEIDGDISYVGAPSIGLWQDAFQRLKRDKVALVAMIVIAIYAVVSILAYFGVIAGDSGIVVKIPGHPEANTSYMPPSSDFLLGTDFLGRSVLKRVIQGSWIAMSVGLMTSAIAIPIGVTLGALAGYFGGFVDEFIVWFYTTVDSIPDLLKIVSLSFVLGRGLTTVYISIGCTTWVNLCRLIRAEFLKHKQRDYVAAANALGASHSRRMFVHILPNVFHIVLINFGLRFVMAIKYEVILSYLGLGAEPGSPSWGIMIDDAKLELGRGVWWPLLAASTAMFFLVLAINIFSDSLREALDPKLRNK